MLSALDCTGNARTVLLGTECGLALWKDPIKIIGGHPGFQGGFVSVPCMSASQVGTHIQLDKVCHDATLWICSQDWHQHQVLGFESCLHMQHVALNTSWP